VAWLDGYRVLDLTDERGLLAGRLLADLGADVVQVEPLTGSAARRCPPLAEVEGRPVSMYWSAFAAGKRGIAADPGSAADRDLVLALAAECDFLLASHPGGGLGRCQPDWAQVQRLNPRCVYVLVSAFGRTGPKSGYAATDLVVWASGGPLEPHRDGDRPPVRISSEQAYLHAGADAAAGALLAHLSRVRDGRGQLVDVSAQVSVAQASLTRVLAAAVGDPDPAQDYDRGPEEEQAGEAVRPPATKRWRCRDGLVELHIGMGPSAGRFTNNLVRWMREHGAVDDELAAVDWCTLPELIAAGRIRRSDMERFRRAVGDFLATVSKEDANAAAVQRRVLCAGILDIAEVARTVHFGHSDWVRVLGLSRRPVGAGPDTRDSTPPAPAAPPAPPAGPRAGSRAAPAIGRPGPRAPADRRPAPAVGQHHDEVVADWLGRPRSRVRPAAGDSAAAALSGLKVLDLSWVVAGPTVGRTLADFGATVVRVESGTRPDPTRVMHPFHGGVPGPENSALYGNCNAGKAGIALDLSRADGRAVARDLARWADVVLASFSPGVLSRWGLDYPALSADRPDLVMLSSSIGGQTGPRSTLAGFGNVGSALSGLQGLAGWPDRPPIGPYGPYTDFLVPRLALVALLAALDFRRRTGAGCHLDLSHVDAGTCFLGAELADYCRTGRVAGRRGNADARFAPHGVYRCRPEAGADRFVAIAVRTDAEWRALAAQLARSGSGRPADVPPRRSRWADRQLAAWVAGRRAEDVERVLQALGVPAHVAAAPQDFLRDPQIAHRGHLVWLPHRVHGRTVVEGPRFLLSGTPGRVTRPAPLLGQDTDRVLTRILGYPPARVAELRRAGALC
jgi:crotonobetainyl-CoA:carnitine CoA-transferase CaiB-like acyl-CoA transferase